MSVIANDYSPAFRNPGHPSAGGVELGTAEALRLLGVSRDGDAWSAILLRHGNAILRMAQRVTGDPVLCDDICQETLLQIRAHAGRFKAPPLPADAEAAARGWIMCIAYRTAVGMIRMRKRRTSNEAEAGMRQLARIEPEGDPLLNAEQHTLVRNEISRLPEAVRSAVCLYFYGEMSYPELSVALDCTEKAARKRVERGVNRLRARLAAAGLVLGAGALAGALGGTAQACEFAGVTAAAATATTAVPTALSASLDLAHLAKWQALLNHSAAPMLTGVAKVGGIAIMTKYVVGVAAMLVLALSGYQAVRLESLSRDLKNERDNSAAVAGRVATLEKQLADERGETAALKASVATRNEEVSRLEAKLAEAEQHRGPAGGTFQIPLGAGANGDFMVKLDGNAIWGAAQPELQARMEELKKKLEENKDVVVKSVTATDGKETQIRAKSFRYETPDGHVMIQAFADGDGPQGQDVMEIAKKALGKIQVAPGAPAPAPKAVKPPAPPKKDVPENF